MSFGFIPAVFFGEAELVSELARVPSSATLFTSMFSHGGLMHLVGNMWFLWLYGDNVEDAMGRSRYRFHTSAQPSPPVSLRAPRSKQ